MIQLNSPTTLDHIREYTRQTAEHTDISNLDRIAFAISVIALLVAAASMVIAFITLSVNKKTLESQKETQSNTLRLNPDRQLGIIFDIARHLYCNMAIVIAIRTILERNDYKVYPSEEHLLKLFIPDNSIALNEFANIVKNKDFYGNMYRLSLHFRNYNLEVESAMRHLADKSITEDIKKNDIKRIIYRGGFVVERICEILDKSSEIFGLSRSEIRKCIRQKITARHEKYVNEGGGIPQSLDLMRFDDDANGFVTQLYQSDPEAFFEMINTDAQIILNNKTAGRMKINVISLA